MLYLVLWACHKDGHICRGQTCVAGRKDARELLEMWAVHVHNGSSDAVVCKKIEIRSRKRRLRPMEAGFVFICMLSNRSATHNYVCAHTHQKTGEAVPPDVGVC